jgi:hypothetical protein
MEVAMSVVQIPNRRNEQLRALQLSSGSWNQNDHPELAEGGAAYIEKIRSEVDERFESAIRRDPSA